MLIGELGPDVQNKSSSLFHAINNPLSFLCGHTTMLMNHINEGPSDIFGHMTAIPADVDTGILIQK
jgi:hypothetical protein